MKIFKITAFLICVLCMISCGKDTPKFDKNNKFISLLPASGTTVEVLVIETPVEINKIAAKFKAAMQENREWWTQYLQENNLKKIEGKPLPYNEKMGITKEEYDKFLNSGDAMTLKKMGEGKLFLTMDSDGKLIINGEGMTGLIKDIKIDLNTGEISTPFGNAGQAEVVSASPGMKISEPWNGYSWRAGGFNLDKTNLKDIRFYLGKLEKEPKGIINYRVKIVDNNKEMENFDIFFKYDLN